MAAPGFADAIVRILQRKRKFYVVVSGTTSATLNTAATLAHTLNDGEGHALVPSMVIPIKTDAAKAGVLTWNAAGTTSAVIDVRVDASVVGGVPYTAICIA